MGAIARPERQPTTPTIHTEGAPSITSDRTTLERDIDTAEQRYQEALASLNRPDGSPMYAPDEQREREQAARAVFNKDLTAVSERLDAIVAEAQAELVAVEAVDPTKTMTTVELERIGLRTAIVTEDLRHLPEAVQVARLRAALTSGGRAERYAALRAGRALLAERERQRGREPTTLRNGRPVVTPPDYSELAAVVRELEAGFIDSARRERAEERIAAGAAGERHARRSPVYGRAVRAGSSTGDSEHAVGATRFPRFLIAVSTV